MNCWIRLCAVFTMCWIGLSSAQTPAVQPSPAPLSPPKFSQTTLPPGAQTAKDATGRTVIGTERQRLMLLDPQYGAVGAGSHHPPKITLQQQAAQAAAWAALSAEEKKKRMTDLTAKIKEAHASYLQAHPEKASSNRLTRIGSVSVRMNGLKLQFKADGRESDIPASFRDIHGNRILRVPAPIETATTASVSRIPSSRIDMSTVASATPGAWHKLNAIMKRNPATGEHLAFLRTSAAGSVATAPASSGFSAQVRACPAWGCNGCRFCHTSEGGDSDGDGISDGLEAALAGSFTPTYHVSNYEQPGTGFATMQDAVPENVLTTYGPTPPISYYRVEPSNFISSGTDSYGNTVYYRYFRIDYLTLWNEDDGLAHGLTCDLAVGGTLGYAFNFAAGIVGFDVAGASASLGGHYLDDEHSAVLLAVPVNGPNDMTIPTDYAQYTAVRYFNSAHEHSPFDASEYWTPGTPIPHDTHIDLYLSQSKHSTYFFNPDRKPIVISQDELNYIEDYILPLAATSIYWDYYDPCPVDDSYFVVLPDGEILFVIDNGDGTCYIPDIYVDYPDLAAYEVLTDELFADCLGEHFTDQGPMFAQQVINVGEPNNPTPGNHFIQDTTPDLAGSKLTESIFPDVQL